MVPTAAAAGACVATGTLTSPRTTSTAEAIAGRRSTWAPFGSVVSRTDARAASLPGRSLSSSGSVGGDPQRPGQRVVEQHPPGPHVVDVHRCSGPGAAAAGGGPDREPSY